MLKYQGLGHFIWCAVAVLGLASEVAAGVAYGQAAPAAASDSSPEAALKEIVITAEHRVEAVQKTPASVSVRNGEDMLAQGRYSLENILEDVPGVTGGAANSTSGTVGGGTDAPSSGLIIRGIASNAGAGGSVTSTAPSAAIYVDDVYNGLGSTYDLERIEVLRGPQGTLYGRSATAGLVAIHTHDPDLGKYDGNATVELGNYELRHYSAALNLPLGDTVAARFSGNEYQRHGYYNGDGGALKSTDGRAKVLFKPNADFSVLLGAALEDNVDHTGGHSVADSALRDTLVYADYPIGEGHSNSRQYWAELNWNLGFGTLTYIPAMRTFEQSATFIEAGPGGYGIQPLQTPSDDFYTHELRLSSGPDSKLIWQTGALYYDNHLSNSTAFAFGPISPFPNAEAYVANTDKSTKAAGVFGEATYSFTDTWRLTAGLRYDYTKIEISELYEQNVGTGADPFPVPANLQPVTDAGSRIFHNWTYKVRVQHDMTPNDMLYGSISTGFSPGDLTVATCPQANGGLTACALQLAAETLTSYELGSKNSFLEDSLRVNGDVFYYDYGAFQSAGINITGNPATPAFATLAVPVQVYGAELEAQYKITRTDRLGVNFAWADAYYLHKSPLFATFVAEDKISSNNSPSSVAPIPVQASIGYDHVVDLPGDSILTLHADARYLSSHEGDLSAAQQAAGWANYVHIGAAGIGDLGATWARKSLSLSGYVRNVTNNQYITRVQLESSPPSAASFQQSLNAPRTYGVVVNVSF